jgi:serine O-acetyltransferase
VTRLIRLQRVFLLGWFARQLLALLAVEVPQSVVIGDSVRFVHRSIGTVLHPQTVLGSRVTIYHGVTTARVDSWAVAPSTSDASVEIGDDAVLCPGSVILFGKDGLRVGRGTVVGANAVLRESTGPWEIWAGVPAKRVGYRSDRPSFNHREQSS